MSEQLEEPLVNRRRFTRRRSDVRALEVLESITDGIYALDREWRYTYINERALLRVRKMKGDELTRQDVLGRNLWEIFPERVGSVFYQKLHEAVREQKTLEFEAHITLPDKWIDVRVYPSEHSVSVYYRDITEPKRATETLRRSQAYLAEAQSVSHTGSWAWNVQTGECVWSLEHFRIFGLDPETFKPTKENTQRLIHPEDLPRVEQILARAIREHSEFDVDYRLVRPDGSIRYHRRLGRPVTNESGELEFIGTVVDVTEAKRAEDERELLLRRAITAHEEDRLRISREIHDELGQHVSALGLKLAALKRDCANQPEIRGEIDSIEKVLHKLDSDLDLLVWNLRPAALDTVGFRGALSNLVANLPKPAGIHAELQTVGLEDAPLPPAVEVVLYRVIQEALNNVTKHAVAKNVYVVLERRAGQVAVIIEDDGKGVDSDRVIDDGRGVGLIGIRERAATLGGTFEFESHAGRGTTVAVRIPLPDVST